MQEAHIDYSMISARHNNLERSRAVESEMARVGHVSLTDALSNLKQSGEMVLQRLEKMPQRYRLKVRRMPDGSDPKPGDVVTRLFTKPLRTVDGKKITGRQINHMRMTGEYRDRYEEHREFVLDSDLCIGCDYEDAGYFLTSFGVHYKTGYPICGKKEVTGGGGRSTAIWNWRYIEVFPWSEFQKPKRGK